MATTTAAWRMAADPEDLREYDGFGPWINEVKDLTEVPRRFRPWWPELSEARHLLKIPRPYDRAQIRPGMDLYKSVIAAFPDKLIVLHAEPTEVTRRDVQRYEVVGTISHTSLLLSRWTILLVDGSTVGIEYNTVSHPIIATMDRYLLSTERGGGASPKLRVVQPENHFFKSQILDLNAGAPVRVEPIHVEEPGKPCLNEDGRRRRSAGMMVLASPEDLVIVNRSKTVQPLFRRANYAYDTIRIPFRQMTSFDLRSPAESSPPSFGQLSITCGRTVVAQPTLTPLSSVVELLTAHGVAAAN